MVEGLFRQHYRHPAIQAKGPGGVAFVYTNFDKPARSQIRKRLGAIALRKRFDEAGYGLVSDLQIDRAAVESAFWQILLPEIRDQVAERIGSQDDAFERARGLRGAGKSKPLVVLDCLAQTVRLPMRWKPGRAS